MNESNKRYISVKGGKFDAGNDEECDVLCGEFISARTIKDLESEIYYADLSVLKDCFRHERDKLRHESNVVELVKYFIRTGKSKNVGNE